MSAGIVWGNLSDAAKKRVLSAVAKSAAEKFETYKDTVVQAFSFEEPQGDAKLEMYRNRVQEVWIQMMQNDPDIYAKTRANWTEMETKRMNREFSAYNPFGEGNLPTSNVEGPDITG